MHVYIDTHIHLAKYATTIPVVQMHVYIHIYMHITIVPKTSYYICVYRSIHVLILFFVPKTLSISKIHKFKL